MLRSACARLPSPVLQMHEAGQRPAQPGPGQLQALPEHEREAPGGATDAARYQPSDWASDGMGAAGKKPRPSPLEVDSAASKVKPGRPTGGTSTHTSHGGVQEVQAPTVSLPLSPAGGGGAELSMQLSHSASTIQGGLADEAATQATHEPPAPPAGTPSARTASTRSGSARLSPRARGASHDDMVLTSPLVSPLNPLPFSDSSS